MSIFKEPVVKQGIIYSLILLFSFIYLKSNTFDEKLDRNGDNVSYYILGKAIAQGKGYTNIFIVGQPAASHFPVGYPVLVAGIMKVLGDDINTIKKANSVLFFLTLIGLLYLFYRLSGNIHLAFVITILLEFNAHLLKFSHIMMSEMPFLFFTTLGLIMAVNINFEKQPWKDKFMYGLIFILFASYHIRTIGITLVGGIILYFLITRKWKHLGMTVVGFGLTALPWFLRNKALGQKGAYLSAVMYKNPYRKELGTMELGDWFTRMGLNLERYIYKEIPSGLLGILDMNYSEEGVGKPMIGILVLVLTVIGIIALKKHREMIIGYIGGTAAILLIWPDAWFGIRFLLPIIPLLAFLSIKGIIFIVSFLMEKGNIQFGKKEIVLPFIMLVFWFPLKSNVEMLEAIKKQKEIPSYENYFALAKWVDKNLPEDVLICSRKPAFFYLYSNRIETNFLNSLVQEEVIEKLKEHGVDYVVLDQLGFSSTYRYLYPAIQKYPAKFQTVHVIKNPDTYLLKFNPELGYWGEWKGKVKEGQGIYRWSNGMYYEGEWKADKREGNGKLVYPNGNVYQGEWKDDKMHGNGVITAPNGNVLQQGIWENNVFIGNGNGNGNGNNNEG